MTLNENHQSLNRPTCSVLHLVEFYAFPHQVIRCFSYPRHSNESIQRELEVIINDITIHKDDIELQNQERCRQLSKLVGMPVLSRINLLDVFSVVERKRYPSLWREFIQINTIFERVYAVNKVLA